MDRQRVHVSPQSNDTITCSAFVDANNARADMRLNSQIFEDTRDPCFRAFLSKPKFWHSMKFMA
jgi:hypothetical protein